VKSLINTRTFALLFLIAISFSCNKTELPEPETPDTTVPPPSEPTLYVSQPGTPTGSATSASIGTAGGSLSTPDGAITLTFPAGALNSDTEISITPITNNAPQGIASAAFRLQPEGLVFNAPVEVKFNYENLDLAGKPEDFLWITTQAANGSWEAAIRSVVDTDNNTVTIGVPHFSDWALGRFINMEISPASATLAKGQSIRLFTTGFRNQGDDADDDDLVPLYPIEIDEDEPTPLVPQAPDGTNYSTFTIMGWALNGANAPVSGANGNLTPDAFQAVYQAPQQVPSPNPVAISLSLQASNTLGGVNNFMLVSNITILDAEYFLTVNFGGLDETYYPWYAEPAPASGDPIVNCMNTAGVMSIWAYIYDENTDVTTEWLTIQFEGLNQGFYPISSDNTSCGDGVENIGFVLNTNDLWSFYDTEKIVRSGTASNCNETIQCSDFGLTISSFNPDTKVIEGYFSGTLSADSPDAMDNCQSETDLPISGTFRLRVEGI
jgi:hypothetical protein